jgi:hypothetical protein
MSLQRKATLEELPAFESISRKDAENLMATVSKKIHDKTR